MKRLKPIKLIKEGSKLDSYLSRRYDSSLFTYRQIFAMLLPLLLDQFFIYFISVLTGSMVSTSGQDSVSAISLVSPITMIIMCLSSAVSSGGTVIIAQYKGMGDEKSLKHAAEQTMLATSLVALICAIGLIVFAHPLVNTLYASAEAAVREKAGNYMIGFCISMIPFAVYQGAFAILRGIGSTKVCLRLTIIINVIHLFGSMIFINVLKLDIMGTALSLIVARTIGCVAALFAILNAKSEIKLHFSGFFKLSLKIQKSIFKLGIPFAAEQVLFNVGSLIVQTYLVVLGTLSVAANANANSVVNLFFSGGAAVATLAITVVGQCIGAGEKEQAKIYGKRMNTLGRIAVIVSIIILVPLLSSIFTLYHAPAETVEMMWKILLIAIIPMPFFWGTSNVMPSVLRAAGDANYTTIVSLITMWAVRVGGGFILTIPCGFGVYGIWIMLGLEWAIRAVVFTLRFKSDKWLNKKAI